MNNSLIYPEKFVTEDINAIMKTLPRKVIYSGITVLVLSAVLLVIALFYVKAPVMIQFSGTYNESSKTVVFKIPTKLFSSIKPKQRVLITNLQYGKSTIKEGVIDSIDSLNNSAIVRYDNSDSEKQTSSNEIKLVAVQINKVSLIKRMWH
jgi:hypothetical protein